MLARALTLGQSEGYVRVFLDEGAPMAKLLRHAGSHGVAPKYVAELLSQFDREIGITPASAAASHRTADRPRAASLASPGRWPVEPGDCQTGSSLPWGQSRPTPPACIASWTWPAVPRRWPAPENSACCSSLLPALLNPKQTPNTPFARWQAPSACLYCALTIKNSQRAKYPRYHR